MAEMLNKKVLSDRDNYTFIKHMNKPNKDCYPTDKM